MGGCCRKKDSLPNDTFSPNLFSRSAVFPSSKPEELPKEKVTVDDPIDLCLTTKDISKDVKRIKEKPVPTLDEALQKLYAFIPDLAKQLAEARAACNKTNNYGVIPDEAAALYLGGSTGGKDSFSDYSQRALRSGNPQKIAPYEDFLKIFFSGYDKLPKLKKDVWLVIPHDDEWAKILKSDNPQLQTRMGPVAISLYQGKEYLNKKYGPAKIIVRLQNPYIANMAGYIKNGVRETILVPGLNVGKFRETEYFENGSILFHLRVVGTKKPMAGLHFVCPTVACGHQCKHQSSHHNFNCNGCEYLIHAECHHCPDLPMIECSFCSEFYPTSIRCKKCQGLFCQKCSLKNTSK